MERASAPESAVATQQELESKKKEREREREQVSYYPIKHKHVYSGIKASSKDTSNNIKSLHFFSFLCVNSSWPYVPLSLRGGNGRQKDQCVTFCVCGLCGSDAWMQLIF